MDYGIGVRLPSRLPVESFAIYATLSVIVLLVYSWKKWWKDDAKEHTAPYKLPLIRSTVPFIFNGLEFLRKSS